MDELCMPFFLPSLWCLDPRLAKPKRANRGGRSIIGIIIVQVLKDNNQIKDGTCPH